METLKKLYITIAVVVFTVAFPVAGRTPLQWAFTGAQALLGVAGTTVRSADEISGDVAEVVEQGAAVASAEGSDGP